MGDATAAATGRAMAAAASSSGRRRPAAVGQEELRRLMREKQRQTEAAGKKKKVDSPFARYNSLGNLSCSLCSVPVKTELLWQTHVLGKQHKEKLAQLKDLKQSVPGPTPDVSSSLKRKIADTEFPEQKKRKDPADCPQTVASGLPADFFSQKTPVDAERVSSKDSSCSLLLGDYEEEDEEEDEETAETKDHSSKPPLSSPVQNTTTPDPLQKATSAAAVASDLLENKTAAAPAALVSHSGSIQKAEVQEKIVERRENTAEALPEGFFDDPEVDAKVRKVDAPKDQMDKEWDEFQKAMRQVSTISEAIMAEEDEEGRLDRQIGEIDEQIECFRRVEQLRDRQDIMREKLKEVMRLSATQAKEDEDLGSEDEGELQDLLSQDWRAKGTLL
ncbi:zinc finger protein 830-like [Eublepharis macularius]|uniref:Zinc finger protein 830 n=1 Tax=Eublepharis macularius TaxID=481883 RepID=A0AA97JZL8_EUBMA|nr:zinc finger protein 830-like [Eublepharis macularius]